MPASRHFTTCLMWADLVQRMGADLRRTQRLITEFRWKICLEICGNFGWKFAGNHRTSLENLFEISFIAVRKICGIFAENLGENLR
jgi:hypothetical protein